MYKNTTYYNTKKKLTQTKYLLLATNNLLNDQTYNIHYHLTNIQNTDYKKYQIGNKKKVT